MTLITPYDEEYSEGNSFVKKKRETKKLPPIIRKTMTMPINEQMSVTLFPEKNGQPQIDVIRLDLTQVESHTTSLYMTPCEAMEIGAGLSSAVQFYLYNQEQYRKEVLEPRLDVAKKRIKHGKSKRK